MTKEELAIKENLEAKQANCDELYNACNDTEKLFVDAYVKRPNKAKAALSAGLSTVNPAQCGWNMYTRPHVKAAITALQDMLSVSVRDVVKMVSDISESNLTDYMTKPVQVPHIPKLEVGIPEFIERLKIEKERIYYMYTWRFVNREKRNEYINKMNWIESEMQDALFDFRCNPLATRIVEGPQTLVTEYVLDKDALIADKERGRVKKIKINKDGSEEFELYSADAAHERLLRRGGEYEKDNKRTIVIAKPVIMDWGDTPDTPEQAIADAVISQPDIIE